MLICAKDACNWLDVKLIEPVINHDASEFISCNFTQLIKYVKTLGITGEMAHDLVIDVYISLVEAEKDGNCFNIDFGDGNVDCVEKFVFGRIKLYAKNAKYQSGNIESVVVNDVSTHFEEVNQIDINGDLVIGRDNKPKTVRKKVKESTSSLLSIRAASSDLTEEAYGSDSIFQAAYMNAQSSDCIEDVAELYSLHEQIDYCISVCSLHDVNVLNILKNIDELSELLGSKLTRKKTAESVFSKITELVSYNDELADALMSVINFSRTNKAKYNTILSTY